MQAPHPWLVLFLVSRKLRVSFALFGGNMNHHNLEKRKPTGVPSLSSNFRKVNHPANDPLMESEPQINTSHLHVFKKTQSLAQSVAVTIFTLPCTVSVLFMLAAGIVLRDEMVWWQGDWGAFSGGRCEYSTETGLLREIINSTTNWGFFFAGCYAVAAGIYDTIWLLSVRQLIHYSPVSTIEKVAPQNTRVQNLTGRANVQPKPPDFSPVNILLASPWLSIFVGLALINVGVSSFIYHACVCLLGGFIDVASIPMPFAGFFVIVIFFLQPTVPLWKSKNGQRIRVPSYVFSSPVFLAIAITYYFYREIMEKYQFDFQVWRILFMTVMALFFLLITVFLVTRASRYHHRYRAFWIISIVLVIVGIGVWIPEEVLRICPLGVKYDPLHGIFHFLMGMGAFFFYCYWRTLGFKRWQDAVFFTVYLVDISENDAAGVEA